MSGAITASEEMPKPKEECGGTGATKIKQQQGRNNSPIIFIQLEDDNAGATEDDKQQQEKQEAAEIDKNKLAGRSAGFSTEKTVSGHPHQKQVKPAFGAHSLRDNSR